MSARGTSLEGPRERPHFLAEQKDPPRQAAECLSLLFWSKYAKVGPAEIFPNIGERTGYLSPMIFLPNAKFYKLASNLESICL